MNHKILSYRQCPAHGSAEGGGVAPARSWQVSLHQALCPLGRTQDLAPFPSAQAAGSRFPSVWLCAGVTSAFNSRPPAFLFPALRKSPIAGVSPGPENVGGVSEGETMSPSGTTELTLMLREALPVARFGRRLPAWLPAVFPHSLPAVWTRLCGALSDWSRFPRSVGRDADAHACVSPLPRTPGRAPWRRLASCESRFGLQFLLVAGADLEVPVVLW